MNQNDADINKPAFPLEQIRIKAEGHRPSEVPLCGARIIAPTFCRCDDGVDYEDENRRDCGCAFGQCANGQIF
jgi:hypothetical protein